MSETQPKETQARAAGMLRTLERSNTKRIKALSEARDAENVLKAGFLSLRSHLEEGESTGDAVMDFALLNFGFEALVNPDITDELREKSAVINQLLADHQDEDVLVVEPAKGYGKILLEKDQIHFSEVKLRGGVISGEELIFDGDACYLPCVNSHSVMEERDWYGYQRVPYSGPLDINPVYFAPSRHAFNGFWLIAGAENIEDWVENRIEEKDKDDVRKDLALIFPKKQ